MQHIFGTNFQVMSKRFLFSAIGLFCRKVTKGEEELGENTLRNCLLFRKYPAKHHENSNSLLKNSLEIHRFTTSKKPSITSHANPGCKKQRVKKPKLAKHSTKTTIFQTERFWSNSIYSGKYSREELICQTNQKCTFWNYIVLLS